MSEPVDRTSFARGRTNLSWIYALAHYCIIARLARYLVIALRARPELLLAGEVRLDLIVGSRTGAGAVALTHERLPRRCSSSVSSP